MIKATVITLFGTHQLAIRYFFRQLIKDLLSSSYHFVHFLNKKQIMQNMKLSKLAQVDSSLFVVVYTTRITLIVSVWYHTCCNIKQRVAAPETLTIQP